MAVIFYPDQMDWEAAPYSDPGEKQGQQHVVQQRTKEKLYHRWASPHDYDRLFIKHARLVLDAIK